MPDRATRNALAELRRQVGSLAAEWATAAEKMRGCANGVALSDAVRSKEYTDKAGIYAGCSRQVAMLLEPPDKRRGEGT